MLLLLLLRRHVRVRLRLLVRRRGRRLVLECLLLGRVERRDRNARGRSELLRRRLAGAADVLDGPLLLHRDLLSLLGHTLTLR
jgi:hypothetical protein